MAGIGRKALIIFRAPGRTSGMNRMAKYAKVALLALVAMACNYTADSPIYHGLEKTNWSVESSVYAAYGEELDSVTEMWCVASKGEYCPTFSEDESGSPDVMPADAADDFDDSKHASYDPNDGRMYVKLGLPQACMRHIIGHELAHSIPIYFDANTCPGATPAPEYGEDRIVEPWHCRGTMMGGANIDEPDSCLDDVDAQTLAAFWDSMS